MDFYQYSKKERHVTSGHLAYLAPLSISSSSLTPPQAILPRTLLRQPAKNSSWSRCRVRTGSKFIVATLQPNECSWKSERDLRAIESEFYVSLRYSTKAVDENMDRLRRRISMLGEKEKHWAYICQQFVSLSLLTGIPMIDVDSGDPTPLAWFFLSLSTVIPLSILSVLVNWIHSISPILASST